MGLFDQWPYTNFHELNLDWILKALKEIQTTTEQFVAINSLKYADPIQWDITSQYEKNTIVIDPQTGTAYISVKAVPLGTALSNTNYWTVVFDIGRYITLASQNFAVSYEAVLTTTATMETAQGDWLVWNSILYEALNDIHIGDRYVVDGNIKKTTVEEFYRRLALKLDLEIQNRINADNTLQGNIDAEALARQNADNTLQGNIDAEALARQNADNTLQGNIDAEALARQNADNTLQGNIDAEALARQNADQAIYSYIRQNNIFDYVVDINGTGDFTSLTACVATVPTGSKILVKKGTYDNEVVNCIGKYLYIIGEDRNKTIIQNNYDDYFRPPMNIAKGLVADISINSDGVNGSTPAYGVHADNDDMYGETLSFINCNITSHSTSGVGIGTRNNCLLTFDNCYIKTLSNNTDAFFIHPSGNANLGGNNQQLRVIDCTIHSKALSVIHLGKVGNNTNNVFATFIGTQLVTDETGSAGTRWGWIRQDGDGDGKIYFNRGAGNNYSILNNETFVPGQTINTGRYINQAIRSYTWSGTVAVGQDLALDIPNDCQLVVKLDGYCTSMTSGLAFPFGCNIGNNTDYYTAYFDMTNKKLHVKASENCYYMLTLTFISDNETYI